MHQNSRRWLLRDTTAKLHDVVDQAVGEFATLDGYKRYLRGQSGFRLPIERQLAQADWPVSFGSWRPNAIADALMADLDDMGLVQPDVADIDLPTGVDELLGMLYVLEGSGLGARILFKRAQTLGLSGEFGARHLAAQSATPAGWNDFLAVLEQVSPLDMERVAHASLTTFGRAATAFESI